MQLINTSYTKCYGKEYKYKNIHVSSETCKDNNILMSINFPVDVFLTSSLPYVTQT